MIGQFVPCPENKVDLLAQRVITVFLFLVVNGYPACLVKVSLNTNGVITVLSDWIELIEEQRKGYNENTN